VKAAPFISSLNVLAVDGIDKVGLAYGGEEFRKQRDDATNGRGL
jgi:hypothetical protein